MENQTERRDRVLQDLSVTVGAVEGMPEKRKKLTTYLLTSSNRSRVVVRKRTICLLGDCESSLLGERKEEAVEVVEVAEAEAEEEGEREK